MSNLTDLLPAGAGGKQVDFVASGTIGNGVTVALNNDGTVTAVTETPVSQSLGSSTLFGSAGNYGVSSAFDSSSNKVVIAYYDNLNSNYGKAVVGTVSGTSISFGTPVIFESAYADSPKIAFDSNSNKLVICYVDKGNLNYGTAIVGTVSGTTISFGTASIFENASIEANAITFDSNSNKVVISYVDKGNSSYGTAIVGTVSGTAISFGSAVVFESASTDTTTLVFDSTLNKIAIMYQDVGNARYGTGIIGTVSGTSISFGSASVFESAESDFIASTFDSINNKVIVAYTDFGNLGYGTAVVGTISGTTISFGSPVVFEAAESLYISCSFDYNANKLFISYSDNGNSSYGTGIVGSVSGTSISFGSPIVFETAQSQNISTTFDSVSNKIVIAYSDLGNAGSGTSVVFQNASTSTNNTDFIGISDAAISDTASGSVTIKGGISTNVTGLTPNSTYYVQSDGSLSTTASDVLAGKALSSTSINLDYTT